MDVQKTCYLFLDFDETVFVNGCIPRQNRDALQKLQEMGHQIILNTGRSRGGLDFSLEKHQGVAWDGMIFGAGDMEYQGIRYHEHHVPSEICLKWVLYGMKHHYWVHLQAEEENLLFQFDADDEDDSEEKIRQVLQEAQIYLENNHITKLTIRHVNEENLSMAEGTYLVQMERYTEIFPDNRNKGVAFLEFCEHYGIPQEQCICFGDSLNDLAIFETCPLSVCMKCAPDELKARATYVAKTDYGVAEWIQNLFFETV